MLKNYTPKEEYPVLNLESKIPFGKYRDSLISFTIDKDPRYMKWFRDVANIDDKTFRVITEKAIEAEKFDEFIRDELRGMTLDDIL